MSSKSYYVTTPIYYVNDKPHIGHAYTTILADVLARYHRLAGFDTFFLTGTDEHGQKVQRAAASAGVSEQVHVDRTVVRFQELWQRLGITHNDFIRTTESRHKVVVQRILQDLYDRDEVYRAEYDGWYCVTCERFYTEKDLTDGKCPESGCGRAVERIREFNYFFRMSKYRDWLVEYIHANPKFIQPDYRKNETLGFLRKELGDLCISRPKTRMAWGVELPFDSNFVTYVWFDALVNYISAVGYLRDEPLFKRWWPASCQLIGKDILTTHTVYWTTMLRAMGLPMPKTVFAHGWWLAGNEKMSKSLGNVVDPLQCAELYGVDAFRYFLMAEMVLGQDASFTEDAFVRRYNADLANDLGNSFSRVAKLVHSHFGGALPGCGEVGADEECLRAAALAAAPAMVRAVEDMRIDQGIAQVTALVRETNRYLEKRQPWTMAKEGRMVELGTTLYYAAETLRIVSGLLFPVMPSKMADLREALGVGREGPDLGLLSTWGVLAEGTRILPPASLFPRMAPAKPANDPVPASGSAALPKPQSKPLEAPAAAEGVVLVDYEYFSKLKLRTAKVLSARPVEKADKLLCLQIDVGGVPRQIVAGIAKHYKPEELPGKTVVVVSNLKPASIRGVESNGMLLAASCGDALRLVTVEGELPSGSTVK